MHTRRYHNNVNSTIDWEQRAHILFGYLIERIGEHAAETWLELRFPDNTLVTYRELAAAVDTKLGELHEAALARIDRQQQAHPGTN